VLPIIPDQPELITPDTDSVPSACDCGACCNACGHDQGCGVYAEPLPVVSEAELRRRAAAAPTSLLAFLLGTEGGAR